MTTPAHNSDAARFWRRTRTVAFWSVVVGVVLELSILGLVAMEKSLPDSTRLLAQVLAKVSWSGVVCLGISCGLAASNARTPIMGLLGAVSGPIGFAIARSVHKGTLQAISNAPALVVTPDVLSPYLLAGIKAFEYGLFGLWLGRITLDENARFSRYARAGLSIGVVFGALFLLLYRGARPEATTLELLAKGVNELVFPIGCAFVLYVTKRTSLMARAA